jgi:type II secretory pathway pseudopilin PulG
MYNFLQHGGATRRGFSLIEVLVSLSIFMVVVTVSVGALMALITGSARARNTQSVMTNVSFLLDSMTREIRTGNDYFCGTPASLPTVTAPTVRTQNCTNATGFSFNEGGRSLTQGLTTRRIAYRLNGTAIEQRIGAGLWYPVTAPEVSITSLRFDATGTDRNDASGRAPTVTIFIKGTGGVAATDGSQGDFNVQATVTQQLLDI